MSLRIQTNIEAFNAHRNLVDDREPAVDSRWSGSRPASGSTGPPTTPPGSRSREKLADAGRRPRPGPAQRAGRRLARADRRRRDGRGAVDAPARPRPRRRSTTTAPCRRPDKAAITSEVAQLCAEISRHRHADRSSTASTCSPAARRSRSRSARTTARRSRSRASSCSARARASTVDSGALQLLRAPSSLASIDTAIDNVSKARAPPSVRCRTGSSTR